MRIPAVAAWSSELAYEVKPCEWVDGALALCSPDRPGQGRPLLSKLHLVRQRKLMSRLYCSICGEPTPLSDRWWFGHGEMRWSNSANKKSEMYFMTRETPLHKACGEYALTVCPRLKGQHEKLKPLPRDHIIRPFIIDCDFIKIEYDIDVKASNIVEWLEIGWLYKDVCFQLP